VPIVVIDRVAPVVRLNGLPSVEVEVFSLFNDPGVTITENYWPLNTVLVQTRGTVNTNRIGTYVRWYIATDPSGNSDSVSRTINVVKTTRPVIRLLGANPYNLKRFCPFEDPGVTIEDVYFSDAELRPALIADYSKLVNHAPGLYSVTYNLIDPLGNRAVEVSRKVNVLNAECVTSVREFKQNGGVSIYPVPSNGLIKIESVEARINHIQVIDMLGAVVKQVEVAHVKEADLNLTMLPAGVYFVKLNTDKGLLTQKISIVK
jgi:hypothetical protein